MIGSDDYDDYDDDHYDHDNHNEWDEYAVRLNGGYTRDPFFGSPLHRHYHIHEALNNHLNSVAIKHGLDHHLDDHPDDVDEQRAAADIFPGSELMPNIDHLFRRTP